MGRIVFQQCPGKFVWHKLRNMHCISRHLSDGIQCAKKTVSDNLGLVDFAIGLVNSVFNLPDSQVKILGIFKLQNKTGKQYILLIKKFFRLVKMSLGLVHAWRASCKIDFLFTWASHIGRHVICYYLFDVLAVLLVLHCWSKRWQIVSSRSRTGHAISDGKSVAVHSEVV